MGAALCLGAGPGLAQTQIVYPAKGQSAQKQAYDESDCAAWAKKRSGFDPEARGGYVDEEKKVTGSGARLIGAGAGGVIAGVAGGNVATGAIVGGLGGGLVKRAKNRREVRQRGEARTAQYTAQRGEYDSARRACLTGRGYTVG